ncbi:MAG: glycosyl hydrolase, partial [Actinomycetota bacterium]|nr:glycosyl hydrolase [Actinomycetota bacterium]
ATVTVMSDFVPETPFARSAPVADGETFAAMLGRVVPEPEGPLPYRRTSTIGDLAQTLRGRLLRRALMAVVRRQLAGIAGDDRTRAAMVERVIEEMPLRGLVMASGGKLSLRALDMIVLLLNAGRRG